MVPPGQLRPARIFSTVPAGRSRWRVLIAERPWALGNRGPIVGEIMDARSRRLEQAFNKPAAFYFTVDGNSPTARLIRELAQEVLVFRWNEAEGKDEPMFRGVITQSQDILSEQRHSVNFVAHDYLGIIGRRFATRHYSFRQRDQDEIAEWFINWGYAPSSGVDWGASASMPVTIARVAPDGSQPGGTLRPYSGRLRDREYPPQSNALECLDNLANVINGFDYDLIPEPLGPGRPGDFRNRDWLRIFYPYRGVPRYDWAFVWGSTVSTVSRSVNSALYANYVRVVGQSEPDEPQVFAEAWSTDATDLISNPGGFWPRAESASDVTDLIALAEKAAGSLESLGLLVPAYSLGLRPGAYTREAFHIGDSVNLRINSGRLDVNTWVRVLALTFGIGEDGQEDIGVDVGRPSPTFLGLFQGADQRISALERR